MKEIERKKKQIQKKKAQKEKNKKEKKAQRGTPSWRPKNLIFYIRA